MEGWMEEQKREMEGEWEIGGRWKQGKGNKEFGKRIESDGK